MEEVDKKKKTKKADRFDWASVIFEIILYIPRLIFYLFKRLFDIF